jgi:leucine dehydrogenase
MEPTMQTLSAATPSEIVRLDDLDTGLEGLIVIHSTRLGPGAGGCRLWAYADMAEATTDALRLAEGMTYKNALAGLPFGGGKAVIRKPAGEFDRAKLFAAFGRAVEALDGRYVTAEDVGTSPEDMAHVAGATRHVAGLARGPGRPGGDPSPHTARGVFKAMELAVARRLDRPLLDVTVAVQGLGNVGFALCRLLHAAGAKLVVAEQRSELASRAASMFGAEISGTRTILAAEAHVFAPCALGAVLDAESIPHLKASVVCGAANNQLATSEDGARLAERGVLYAPDYVVNSGGIINVAAEYLGWSLDDVERRVGAVGKTLGQVLDYGNAAGLPPHEAADALAREILARPRAVSPAAPPMAA